MNATDIVAYTYQADIHCEYCIAWMFECEHGPSILDGVEAILAACAAERGIDYDDEGSYDSGDFPKAVFADQVESDDYCGTCYQSIID